MPMLISHLIIFPGLPMTKDILLLYYLLFCDFITKREGDKGDSGIENKSVQASVHICSWRASNVLAFLIPIYCFKMFVSRETLTRTGLRRLCTEDCHCFS